MIRKVWVFCLLVSASCALFASTQNYQFTVYLDGKEIGQHAFEFDRSPAENAGYQLISDARYQVKILFVTVYEYRHRSLENWRDGCVEQIKSATSDNGDDFVVTGQRFEDGLAIEVNGDQEINTPGCVRTFAYWDRELLRTDRLLNSQTGELEAIDLNDVGRTPLPWDGKREARTVELKSESGLIRLWYGEDDRWLGLSSRLENGRVLEYRLEADTIVVSEMMNVSADGREWSL